MLCSNLYIFLIFSACNKSTSTYIDSRKSHNYYFSEKGDDKNDGSFEHPLKTIGHLNTLDLTPGDSIFLKGGEIFNGNLVLISTKQGMKGNPIVLTSYGSENAIINAANGAAITIDNLSFVNIKNLTCNGSGRKNGNTKSGVSISNCNTISIDHIDVSGFQKSGLQLFNCKNVTVTYVSAHDNGAAGIGIEGDYSNKSGTHNIYISNCTAVNNPGDPSNLTNHSGNGIVAGHCTLLVIDHCMATNNGWDMPRIGNGPVGIWCYESDSVIIQRCLSYRNKTSVGGADGGGFDFDGGVTNSIIQYCFSYENQGSGYCMFQYWGASPWHHNVIRYNISENDGLVSDSRAGLYIWNSSEDEKQFHDCDFYNNTIYNSKEAVMNYSTTSQRKNFRFLNNIFVGKDSLIRGQKGNDLFLANDWWSLEKKFEADGINDFATWVATYPVEQIDGLVKGLNVIPPFKNPGIDPLQDVTQISSFDHYKIDGTSPVMQGGLDLRSLFSIDPGNEDFNGRQPIKNFMGACTHQ